MKCEYMGFCRLDCPPDQLDCQTYVYYQENQDELDRIMKRQTYRNTKLKHIFREERPRRRESAGIL